MSESEENIFDVLSDFIKGKRGHESLSMAKVSWDGTEPRTLPPRPKLSDRYNEFILEYPIVISGLSRCFRPTCLALVGAMLTLPELQSHCFRLEVLAHLAIQVSTGKSSPTAAQLCAWFNQLDNGTCGRQEDPAEDIFIANVHYASSNYRIFEGTAEANAFHTQIFLNILDGMPDIDTFLILR